MALATRILVASLAAFMFGIAALMVAVPFFAGGTDHSGDWIVAMSALVVAGFGVFTTFAFVALARVHITLNATTLSGTVVDGHGVLFVPRFRSFRIALAEIETVERRTEIFRTLGASTMRDAVSVVTASAERIGLFSNTLGSVDTLPLDEVADAIARAAGISVTDDGTVRTKGSGLYGAASSSWTEPSLDPASAYKARRGVLVAAQVVSALVLLTFVLRGCL